METKSRKDEERPCITRREFLFAGGSVVLLNSVPGLGGKVFAKTKEYPRKRIMSLSALSKDKPTVFRYPFDEIQCNSFIVKLDEEAGGGVGSDKDIVAFSSFCPHMGGPLMGVYDKEYKVAGPCPLHLSTFDLTRHGMVISGHSTQALPQVMLEIEGNAIYAVGVLGLIYGFDNNLNASWM